MDVPGDLEIAAERLARLLDDLEGEARAIEESTAESPDDEHDSEGSTIGFERARVASLLAQTARSLQKVREAIRRRQEGTYGHCEGCGGPIGAERLEALPTTELCVGCALSST